MKTNAIITCLLLSACGGSPNLPSENVGDPPTVSSDAGNGNAMTQMQAPTPVTSATVTPPTSDAASGSIDDVDGSNNQTATSAPIDNGNSNIDAGADVAVINPIEAAVPSVVTETFSCSDALNTFNYAVAMDSSGNSQVTLTRFVNTVPTHTCHASVYEPSDGFTVMLKAESGVSSTFVAEITCEAMIFALRLSDGKAFELPVGAPINDWLPALDGPCTKS